MHITHRLGFGSRRRNPTSGTNVVVEAQSVSLADTLTVGVVPTVSYTFYSSDSSLAANQPPYADSVELTGIPLVGETLTASITGLVVPNGGAGGPHDYVWYRYPGKRGATGVIAQASTSPTYVLQEADDGSYMQVQVTLRQYGVKNTTGETYKSLYTAQVTSDSFNPITDIIWDSAYIPLDLPNFVSAGNQWTNRGTLGPLVQDGVNAVPVYDSLQMAMKFTRANLQWLTIPKKSPQWTGPWEIYVRVKFDTLPASQYIFGFTNGSFIGVTSTGGITINGTTVAAGIVADTWHSIRIIMNGAVSTIEVDHGAPIGIDIGIATAGTGTGRMGATFSRTASLDAWVSHIFIKQTPGDAVEQENMWDYLMGTV